MKKYFSVVLTLLFVSGMLLANTPKNVEASKAEPAPVQVASGGNWSSGRQFTVDINEYPAPNEWVELISQGVKATKTGKLCHPFRGHFFQWEADIYQLVDGSWVKKDTTFGYANTVESDYVACVQAKAGQKYAMFGYYTGEKEY